MTVHRFKTTILLIVSATLWTMCASKSINYPMPTLGLIPALEAMLQNLFTSQTANKSVLWSAEREHQTKDAHGRHNRSSFSQQAYLNWAKQAYQIFINYHQPDGHINRSHLSPACYQDLLHMKDVHGFHHTSHSPTPLWQKHMIDSSGRMPAGLLEGNVFWMGDFTQCTKVKVWTGINSKDHTRNSHHFKGKYCLANLNHYLTVTTPESIPIIATFGICVPSTCRSFEVEKLVNEVTHPLRVVITNKECLTDDPHAVDSWTVYALLPLVVLGTIVMAATICEIIPLMTGAVLNGKQVTKRNGTFRSAAISFSAYTNTVKLLNTHNRNNALSCINGIRALSMMGVVVGNALLSAFGLAGRHNPLAFAEYIEKLIMQPILYANYIVVTFFCLTGFLVTCTVMAAAVKTGRFNIVVFYVHRLWRLTPTILLVFLLATGPILLTVTGPLWIRSNAHNSTLCRANLWRRLLYSEIYFGKREICMQHLWYLDAELAIYVMSAIIMYPIVKKHWMGPVMWIIVALASTVSVATIAHKENLQDIISPYLNQASYKVYLDHIYIMPWSRAQPFLVGMLFGFVYFYKGKNLRLNKVVVATLWVMTAIAMLGCLFINYPYAARFRGPPSHAYQVAYITLQMAIWSTAIGWIILGCATGYGGVVNRILSWNFLVPIGRLSFCAYVVHMEVLISFSTSRKNALYLEPYFLAYYVICMNIAVLFFAWILCLLIEAPTLQLEKLLMKSIVNEPRKENSSEFQKTNGTSRNITRKYPTYQLDGPQLIVNGTNWLVNKNGNRFETLRHVHTKWSHAW